MTHPVVLLFGGTSSERRVSVASAQHLLAYLGACEAWFVAPAGAVHVCEPGLLARHAQAFVHDFEPGAPAAWPELGRALDSLRSAVVVLALHGGEGEDGTVQRALEARGLAFTGSGSAASALAFDKALAKERARGSGVRTVPGEVLPAGDAAAIARALEALHARHRGLVVKPVADGSSVGLYMIHDTAEIEAVAGAVAADGRAFLAEALVRGTELTVGVVDGPDGPRALPVTEIRVDAGRVFDYEGKYLSAGTREITPARVPDEVARQAAGIGVAAHVALGCEGYSRTDVILDEDRGGAPVFLELNTLPGLTRASLIPQQLEAEGTSMAAFVAAQIELAIRRRDARSGA